MTNWFSNILGRGADEVESIETDLAPSTPSLDTEQRSSVQYSTMDTAEVLLEKLGLTNLRAHVTAKNSMGIAAFYGCVRFISEVVSSLPYNAYRYEENKGAKKAVEHPLSWVLGTRFNKNMTPFSAKKALLVNYLVHGWAIAEVKRDWLRNTVEIVPIPCSKAYILHDPDSDSYFFNVPTQNRILSQDDVIFIKGLDFNGAVGTSVVNWQSQTIKIDLLSKEFIAKYYEKGTFMGGILETQAAGNIRNQSDADDVKDRFVGAFENTANGKGYGVAVLANGSKFTPVGRPPVESQLLELFDHSETEIAMMFGLSLSMIGNTRKNTSFGTGVESAFIGVTNTVLVPIAKQIEEEVDYKCFRKDEILDGYYTKFNFKGLLRGDLKAQAEHSTKMVSNGIYMPNEVRELDEMPPLPNGTGDRGYMNGTMTPMELIDEVKKPKGTKNGNGKEAAPAGV